MNLFGKIGVVKHLFIPLFIFCLGFVSVNANANSFVNTFDAETSVSISEENIKPLGSIVLVDVVLIVNTDDKLNRVAIRDENGKLVANFKGCGGNICEYDLSNLTPGDYTVIAKTAGGQNISQQIKLK